jgi:uncharacterized alkaline shock family protein YloU
MVDVLAPGEPLQIEDPIEPDSALGTTRVANEVVAQIAALAALDTKGVHAMYKPSPATIERLLKRTSAHKGVKVIVRDDDTLRLDLYIAIAAGTNIPQTGAAVQQAVSDAVEKMLGIHLGEVNILVSEVVFPGH